LRDAALNLSTRSEAGKAIADIGQTNVAPTGFNSREPTNLPPIRRDAAQPYQPPIQYEDDASYGAPLKKPARNPY